MGENVPASLRGWFMIHFGVDMLFALPLLFFPVWTLGLFGIIESQTITARLVAAALIGIGGVSLWSYKKSKEHFESLLMLKIIWSFAAIIALLLSLLQGASAVVWLLVVIFAVFNGIWMYYLKRL